MSDKLINHIKQLITDLRCSPADIHYDRSGVYVTDILVPTDHPRYYFAQALSFFEEDIRMYGRGYQSYFAENTVCDFRKIKFGYNCLIGGSGFGYEYFEGIPFRIPHLGNVIIHDGVEIHNSVCIDRAVIGSTVIGENCKIDNLVHIAHGVKIGKNCLIVAGTVIGGSCEIGENCFIGINASIKNKVKIGSNVTIGMGAVVTKDVPDGAVIVGNPGKPLEKLWPLPELKSKPQ